MRPAVVIPAWNAAEMLRDTVESVLTQSHASLDVVIVDDGSTDETPDVARTFTRDDTRVSVVRRANGGLSLARNTGFEHVADSADCVLFLDSDDVLEPDALGRLVAALESSDASVIGAYGLPRDMTHDGVLADIPPEEVWGYTRWAVQGWRRRELSADEPTGFGTFVIWPAIETAGQALIRVDALKKAGLWRSMPGEDWEMWLRLSALGNFNYLREFTLRKRATRGSLSSNGRWLARAEPMIRTELTSGTFTADQRKQARIGELYSVAFKMSWAWSALRSGEPAQACKQGLRAAQSAARLGTRVFRY